MKKLIFKKGINRINIPFMLTNFEPWQNQVANEMKKIKKNYTYRKDAELGFSITNIIAEITLTI
jgi:hypothetical protein